MSQDPREKQAMTAMYWLTRLYMDDAREINPRADNASFLHGMEIGLQVARHAPEYAMALASMLTPLDPDEVSDIEQWIVAYPLSSQEIPDAD